MQQISVGEVMMLNSPLIIDVRSAYSYSMGHIRGAKSVPYYNLLNNYSHYLTRYDRYYLYCDTGEQSAFLASRLRDFGYDTVNIMGGYQEYLNFIGGGKSYY